MKWMMGLIFTLASLNSNATEWVNISSKDNPPVYFDRDSIVSRYDGNGSLIVSAWTMSGSDHPIVDGAVKSQMLNYANCSDMSIKHVELLELDKQDKVIWRMSQAKHSVDLSAYLPLEYYYPEPGSNFRNNINIMCDEVVVELGFYNAER